MTKRVKPKQDVSGKYVKNGAAAKSGLNDAILRSMWGMVIVFIRYKGLKKEKLTIKIPPHRYFAGVFPMRAHSPR